ncbi:AI-2E family transporter [bacterium]|nr:AI-2E family transporter [candidate division CSSED10-310 bacterium]
MAFKVVQPYFSAIVVAALVASIFQPIHRWILIKVRNRSNLAAFLSSVLLVFLVLLPLVLMGIALVDQGASISRSIMDWIKSGEAEKLISDNRYKGITEKVRNYLPQLDIDNFNLTKTLISVSSSTARFILDQSGHIAANVSSMIMNFSMMIFIFFFFVRDGSKILTHLLHLIPLSSSQEDRIIKRIKSIAKSVFLGTILTAVAQGLAAGIGFAICGIPALFWGSVLAFSSLIPVVGTALVWIPAALFLALTGHFGFAVFLAVYCVAVVGSIDNFLRPVFMKGAGGMSTFMIFLSIIGGIQCFGFSGLLYGPLVFGLAWVLLIIYETEFRRYLSSQDNS